jgi:hypothetical protein
MVVLVFLVKIKAALEVLNGFLLSSLLGRKIELQDEVLPDLFFKFGLMAHLLYLTRAGSTS